MRNANMMALKAAARLKLDEAGISADPMQFERFWEKFSYNLVVASKNEEIETSEKLRSGLFRDMKPDGYPGRAVAAALLLGWLIGRVQGLL